jgi:membrane protease YdiL (CAAX protease family)
LGFEPPVPFLYGLTAKLLLASLFTAIFAFGEELGWSGFLIPRLLKVTTIPTTVIISGLYFALWHFPAIIAGFYGQGTPLWVSLPGFALVCVGSYFFKVVLIKKSRSFWPGVILHTAHNVVLMGMFFDMTVKDGFSAYLVSETGIFLGLVYLTAGILFWKTQVTPIQPEQYIPQKELR